MKSFKDYLLEMPYVSLDFHNKHIDFDLELELYQKDIDKFIDLITRILNSHEVSDKYGNIIHLTDDDQKKQFIHELTRNQILSMFLQKYHHLNTLKLLLRLPREFRKLFPSNINNNNE